MRKKSARRIQGLFQPCGGENCGWPVLDCCKNKVKDDSENWIAAEISYQGWPENGFLDCSP